MPGIECMKGRYRGKCRIRLECGHFISRTSGQIEAQQLEIGKCISCPFCASIEAAYAALPPEEC